MRNLAIDLGNTRAKIAFFEENTLVETKKGILIEELAELIKNHQGGLIVSSVTKTAEELALLFGNFKDALILSSNTPLPIQKNYDTPQTLGSDRLAAAVGANFLFPSENCLIIDMGTAIKYDYVSKAGVFEGGVISPGLRIRFEALHTFTKRLPLIEAEGIPDLIGKSTKTCIQSGVVNGIIHEANGFIAEYQQLGDCKVILSGGDANFFEMSLKKPTFVVSDIVLIGLNQILRQHLRMKSFV
jgi:type III pantothenate kinase